MAEQNKPSPDVAASCGGIVGFVILAFVVLAIIAAGCLDEDESGGSGSSSGRQAIQMPSDPCSTDLFIYKYGFGEWVVNHPRYDDPTPVSSLPIPPIIVEHAEQPAEYTTNGIVPLKAAYLSAGFCD